jgi:hypothetical protein
MAATPIAGSLRYIPEGVRHFYYCPAIATIASPTRTELNAGTDLTPEVASFGNWGVLGAEVQTPDLASRFVPSVPGLISVDGPTIGMYADSTSADVRTLLPRDTAGFIVVFPEGDIATRKMDVFPVKVLSAEKQAALGGTPATIEITFSVTKLPAENVTVPA